MILKFFFVFLVCCLQCVAALAAPQPRIWFGAGDSGTVWLDSKYPARVSLALEVGESAGTPADWWVFAETPYGIFHYQPFYGWHAGMARSYQGALFELNAFDVLNMRLPIGTYLLHFAVDAVPDGILNADHQRASLRIHVPGSRGGELNQAGMIIGRVVALDGTPISGARVQGQSGSALTDSAGWFGVPAGTRPEWLHASHTDFLPRTRAAQQGDPVLFRLSPDDGATLSFHFAGDTMVGRRFYDPNSDGDPSDGLVPPAGNVVQHIALLESVRPLLENASLSVVNFETPLTEAAYFDLTQTPPPGYHDTKDYVFATHPNAAYALKHAGVDVVDLGNNHLYDYLEQGISDTHLALQQAGLAHYGAGHTEDEAWQPKVMHAAGQRVAFLGCTTITGSVHPLSYVADDAQNKGGAARCTSERISRQVSAAAAVNDVVVFMIHGGMEYGRAMSDTVSGYSALAREAGARLVINHHPHVVGGFDWDGSAFTAATLGNFLFDQTVWTTLESYLLGVHVRHGEVIRAYAEPLQVEAYLPKGVTGSVAEYTARGAAGRMAGPFVVESGAMETDFSGVRQRLEQSVPVSAGVVYQVPENQWVSAYAGDGELRLGRDLLMRSGSFEDEDVDADSLEASLWRLEGVDKVVDSLHAYSGHGGTGLFRDEKNISDVLLTTLYRIFLDAGTELSLVGRVRTTTGGLLTAQLSWYPNTRGGSSLRTIVPMALSASADWQTFRVDGVMPEGIVAVQPFFKLSPPESGAVSVELDDIRLIHWAEPDTPFRQEFDHIVASADASITLSQDILPGAEDWRARGTLERF
jgi:poly-gamma-glutamate capsule biosynthesis protein CapA/YwtB (metallophosphatase superfamily)